MTRPYQQVELRDLGSSSLQEILALNEPPFLSQGEAHQQLQYVEALVRDLGCLSVLIEEHYIDRHYMEDHSVFYSRSLYPYANSCRRVHFFSCGAERLESLLVELREGARSRPVGEQEAAAQQFSRSAYLGFCVIKPLAGCPVGRTVLRTPGDTEQRRFACVRDYKAHLGGLELSVRGLAFQQQDVGVSACATTAIWVALQKFQDFEDIALATPAQITTLASQYTLPFGRAMPSEGLSVDQMCQAIRALGVAPNLFYAADFETARAYLYSAISSELAPILILQSGQDYHAVVASGMEVRARHEASFIGDSFADDRAGDLVGLYIHDDRIGPYVHASVRSLDDSGMLEFCGEAWKLTHVLIPMHAKIRLSFSGLRRVASHLVQAVQAYREAVLGSSTEEDPVLFDTWITPSYSYLKSLLAREPDLELERIEDLWQTTPLSRYVGVVRLETSALDPIHFLVDCTSTERNLHSLAVLALKNEWPETALVTRFLAEEYAAQLIA